MPPKRSAVTIKDIAAASGVSYPTVSYVLNNTRPVAPATRKRVLDAVSRLNYHPSAIARGLLKQRMSTVGIVLPYTADFLTVDPYLGPIIEGIVQILQAEGQTAMLFPAPRRAEGTARDSIPLYCDGRSDGILFIHEPTQSALIQAMAQTRVPFVCINELQDGSTVSAVDAAQEEGAYQLTRHLIAQGHRRIAFLPGETQVVSSGQRTAGFHRAMVDTNLPVRAPWTPPGEYHVQSGYDRTRALWQDQETLPTALVCCNDLIAFGAIRALRDLNVRVPEDVSVVGFDDIPDAARHDPPLTTMRLPFREGGALAAQMLLRHIALGDAPAEQEILPMTLIERQTVLTAA